MSVGLVCVLGDLMVDHYVWGEAKRLSPEAPVPVVATESEESRPGGAALVAANLKALGLNVEVYGAIGADKEGEWLLRRLERMAISTAGVEVVHDRPTTQKTRVMASQRQLGRFDRELTHATPDAAWQGSLEKLNEACAAGCRYIVVSNYNKGVLTEARIRQVLALTDRYPELEVMVDPKNLPWESLRGAALVKPNRVEFAAALGCEVSFTWEEVKVAADRLRRESGIETLIVTLGGEGIAALSDSVDLLMPAHEVGVYDVTGAGDAVLAALASGAAKPWSWSQRLAFANRCGALSVQQTGTVVIDPTRLEPERPYTPPASRCVSREEAMVRVNTWRAAGEVIVFTNGCYDLLHSGHIQLLEAAKAQGTKLLVALNTDASVRRLKGSARPVVDEQSRAEVLAALRCVDAVVFFDEDTPLELIASLKPDVLCKGADYQPDEVVGAELVQGWGGRVELLPLKQGSSTSNIIARILQLKES